MSDSVESLSISQEIEQPQPKFRRGCSTVPGRGKTLTAGLVQREKGSRPQD